LSEPTGLVVCGAAGRMGRMVIALAGADPAVRIVGAIEAPGAPAVGLDAGTVAGVAPLRVAVSTDVAAVCRPERVVVDFTVPEATLAHARAAAAAGAALVVGTTGLTADQDRELRRLAATTRSVIAANYSVGVTVLTALAAEAARLLGPGFDAEIVELHHHHKRDAPSGTALALGRAVAAAQGRDFERAKRLAREGLVGARGIDEIGIVALRAGDAVGDHTVVFGGVGERLELTHRAQSRESLAHGALRAASWVAGRAPGVYTMRDVLGL
jgi:4-hydroxy-tetrahydrodipicolinate reductase